MTIKELLERLERLKDGLSDVDNRYGIEGTMDDIALLMDDVDSFGVEDDDGEKLKEENEFLQKDSLSMFNRIKELLHKIEGLEKENEFYKKIKRENLL